MGIEDRQSEAIGNAAAVVVAGLEGETLKAFVEEFQRASEWFSEAYDEDTGEEYDAIEVMEELIAGAIESLGIEELPEQRVEFDEIAEGLIEAIFEGNVEKVLAAKEEVLKELAGL
jgi:hypothetical protein